MPKGPLGFTRLTNIGPLVEEPDRISIKDAPQSVITQLQENIVDLVEKCSSSNNVTIEAVYLFGSYARGTAIKGESDLDMLVVTDASTPSALCMGENSNDIVDGLEEWFDGSDIGFHPTKRNALIFLRDLENTGTVIELMSGEVLNSKQVAQRVDELDIR